MENWKKAVVVGTIGTGAVLALKGKRVAGVVVAGVGAAVLAAEYPEKLEALRSRRLEIKTRDLKVAHSALAEAGYAVKTDGSAIILSEARAVDAPEEVARLLVHAGTPPSRLAVEQEDLEDYFLRLTGEKI